MFKKMDRKRLLELAGIQDIQHGPEDRSMSPHHQDAGDESMGGDESEHLDNETSVFSKVHDALEELLSFLQGEEGFEEKRGKEEEYSQMEHDAEDLKNMMKKHLSGYKGDEGTDEGELEGDENIKMVKPTEKPNKMSFR